MAALHLHKHSRWAALVVIPAVMIGFCPHPAVAENDETGTPTWYVVGGPEPDAKSNASQVTPAGNRNRPDFGLSFSRIASGEVMPFTSGATSPRADRAEGYALLVSGAYDFDTGTMVTPRLIGGVGVSYLSAGPSSSTFVTTDPTVRDEVAPTAHIGFGAEFDLGDTWTVSAEYRAMYLGENDREGSLGESRLDQKFTVGAKVRF